MALRDTSTAEAYRQLSVRETVSEFTLSRRRFLQGVSAVGGAYLLRDLIPGSSREAFAAAPLPADAGVLVLLMMGGGNDGLNTLIPYGSGHYYDARGAAAIAPADVLAINGEVGLHPNLGYLKSLYEQGNVAITQGVGYENPDLSHFVSMARWMSAWGGSGHPYTGWVGRWLDALGTGGGTDPLDAVHIGSSIPLHLVGAQRQAATVGTSAPFGASTATYDIRVHNAIRAMAAGPSGLGPLGDSIVASQLDLMNMAGDVAPLYTPPLPEGRLLGPMSMAARLINADLGVRVLSIGWGDFDSHDGLISMHGERMGELDAALAAFYATLAPAMASRVTILTFSEFGRHIHTNGNLGTDHGTAGVQLAIGAQVRGGLYGEMPDLSPKQYQHLRLDHTVEFNSVFGSVLDQWLRADHREILGRAYEPLELFAAGPGATIPTPPPGPAAAGGLVALSPLRRLDTRVGMGAPRAPLGPGASIDIGVAANGEVPPTGATAVVMNVTAVAPSTGGYLTIWPTGEARPNASNLNFVAGQTVPNLVLCKLGERGRVSVFNPAGSTHVIADVVGYLSDNDALGLVPLAPTRLEDTRESTGPIGPDSSLVLSVAAPGVPESGVSAVVLNVTATAPTASTYLTVHPAGEDRPLASNLNVVAGQTSPNLVVAKLGANDMVEIYNAAGSTHVVVDLLGYVAADSDGLVVPVTPERALDTREAGSGGALGTGEERAVPIGGRGQIPAVGVRGLVINVTVTQPQADGYVVCWPADLVAPLASNLNFVAGQTVPNLVVVATDSDGAVKLKSTCETHVVIDVVGYIPS